MISHAYLKTDKAARYMTQLSKHWAHKYPVELTDTASAITLAIGRCRMAATAEGLSVEVEIEEPAGLERLQSVVSEHLLRFAFREAATPLAWTLGPAA